jgi:hypothetical protein
MTVSGVQTIAIISVVIAAIAVLGPALLYLGMQLGELRRTGAANRDSILGIESDIKDLRDELRETRSKMMEVCQACAAVRRDG